MAGLLGFVLVPYWMLLLLDCDVLVTGVNYLLLFGKLGGE
jgi:hypothetical protein